MRNAQLFTHAAHLVLEQVLERLDDAGEVDVGGQADLVVVGLDGGRVALAALDAVGIDRALGEEAARAARANLVPEDLVELGADGLALLLGVGNAPEPAQELLLAVDAHEVHVEQAGEGGLDEVALVLAHQALIHEYAGELFAHRAGEQRRRD